LPPFSLLTLIITFFWPRHERPLAPSITRPPARRRRRRRRHSSFCAALFARRRRRRFASVFLTPFLRFFRSFTPYLPPLFYYHYRQIARLDVAFAAITITMRCRFLPLMPILIAIIFVIVAAGYFHYFAIISLPIDYADA
jgi:hypothetical protein